MKMQSAACAVLFAFLAFSPAAAVAQTALTPSAQAAAKRADEASAARKHRRHVRVYRYYDPVERNRSFGFVGGYPGEYAWRRSIGQTVCDLGYGRWDSCDSR